MRHEGSLLLAAAFLAGCATRPPGQAGTPWVSGHLTLRLDGTAETPARSLTGLFDLRGDGRSGEFRLSSPLGTWMASLQWSPGTARLRSSEGETDFADLDELSRRVVGEALPLQALPDWLAARPWPGAPSSTTAEGFEQMGWRIGLARWADGLIDAERAATPRVSLRLRLDR